jgi:hypothetical protein
MAEVSRSEASLRFLGDDLDPHEITTRLGVTPTRGSRKGELFATPLGRKIPSSTGYWSIVAPTSKPAAIDEQVMYLLNGTTDDLDTWRDLARRHNAELFVGLFLERGNEGMGIRPETLAAIGARELELSLDIYSGYDNEDEEG